MKTIKPFVKWAGGKRQFIPKLMPIIPEYKRYIEPFLGGGAMLFALRPSKFIANDINVELYSSYISFQQRNELEVLKGIDKYASKHSEEHFKKVRSLNIEEMSPVEIASRFIYLNKGGFNGLYRLNNSGGFNVPWNKKPDTKFYDKQSIIETAEYLEKSKGKFYNGDYKKILNMAKEGDFVFVDPPYDNTTDTKAKTFDAYTPGGFGVKGQEELAAKLIELSEKGVKWILCNYDTPLIKKLYKGNNKLLLDATRSMSSDASKRKGTFKEVFYYNYEI